MLRPAIDQAMVRCRAQIEAGVNLPRTYAVMAELLVLAGDTEHGLDAFAKALRSTSARDVVDDTLRALDLLVAAPSSPADLEWARRLLLLGVTARFGSPTRAEELIHLATRDERGAHTIRGPVVVVAGGTDPGVEQELARHTETLVETFKDFTGTIVSGGTEQGVSGIVGQVGTHDDGTRRRITTIGYLPDALPADGSATRDLALHRAPAYRDSRVRSG